MKQKLVKFERLAGNSAGHRQLCLYGFLQYDWSMMMMTRKTMMMMVVTYADNDEDFDDADTLRKTDAHDAEDEDDDKDC